MGSPDPSSASALNASVHAVQPMRLVPVDWVAVIQLVVAAGLPMLAVVSTQMPLADLPKWLAGTIPPELLPQPCDALLADPENIALTLFAPTTRRISAIAQ